MVRGESHVTDTSAEEVSERVGGGPVLLLPQLLLLQAGRPGASSSRT
jgi:hypothetical protein